MLPPRSTARDGHRVPAATLYPSETCGLDQPVVKSMTSTWCPEWGAGSGVFLLGSS